MWTWPIPAGRSSASARRLSATSPTRPSQRRGDDERVFVSPTKGTPFDVARYSKTLKLALTQARIDDHVRPFHDGRHTSITNAAAAGLSPAALMARAGHSDFKTTRGYIDLAGERFREEAGRAEERLWGRTSTKNRYKVAEELPQEQTA
jgi:integrase